MRSFLSLKANISTSGTSAIKKVSPSRIENGAISIYLREPYPIGMACTKRIHLYAKGLIACGNEVKIILPKATETIGSCYNKSIKGIFQGVPYEYSSKTINDMKDL